MRRRATPTYTRPAARTNRYGNSFILMLLKELPMIFMIYDIFKGMSPGNCFLYDHPFSFIVTVVFALGSCIAV